MFSVRRLPGWASVLCVTLALALPGCKDDDGDPGGGDTDDGGVCPECEAGQAVFLCIIGGEEDMQCFDDLAAAQASCGAIPGNGVVGNAPVPCDNQTPDPSVSWEPGSFVAYDEASGIYNVDPELLAKATENPTLLLNDRARLTWRGGHFEFKDIARGDLVDLLGFVEGDVLVEINGYPMTTMLELGEAYDSLQEGTAFTVVVARDGSTIMLEYSVVDDD